MLAITSVSGCSADDGVTQSSDDIVGGKPATAYKEAVTIDGAGFFCSGTIIAPHLVLTAGHCVRPSPCTVIAPYAEQQQARGVGLWTDYSMNGPGVNPEALDVGLIQIEPAIELPSYPVLAKHPVRAGTVAVNVGRVQDAELSWTDLFVGKPVKLGFDPHNPLAYVSEAVAQAGDSGGAVYVGSGDKGMIVAVNSAADDTIQVLARVDLAYAKIQEFIAEYR